MKLCVCFITYNHPRVVDDVLSNCLKQYFTQNIDIIYFDSSERNHTQKIINKYQEEGFSNLFYIKLDPSIMPNQKIETIFSSQELKNKYDFIWLCKDRSYVSQKIIRKIVSQMQENPEIIFLDYGNCAKKSQYNNVVEFYNDCASWCTSIDTLIYNTSLITENSKLFFQSENKKNYNFYWPAYSFLFNIIASLPNPTISIIAEREQKYLIYNSPFGKSMWTQDIFSVVNNAWVSANDNLPSCYNNFKPSVIKQFASFPWILGSIKGLCELHSLNVLTNDTLENALNNWERISDIPVSTVKQIALGQYQLFHNSQSFEYKKNDLSEQLINLYNTIEKGQSETIFIPYDEILHDFQDFVYKNPSHTPAINRPLIGSVYDILQFMSKEKDVQQLLNYIQILLCIIQLM